MTHNLSDRRLVLDALGRLLKLCGIAAESGEPSGVALLAALDEVQAAAKDHPGPIGTAAILVGETFVAMAGPAGEAELTRLRDSQTILRCALAAERALTFDEAHRLIQ
jgi:hypothetical protein